MLLVRRIGGVLTAVLAAEVLTRFDHAHAPHVLAVHADLPSP
jgi:hypothetical protein